jgi:long-chain acyl-CoA synthetase
MMKTFTGAFAARVAAQPADVALRTGTAAGGLQLTWADYADQACRLAAAFRDLGLRRGERVALMLRNRPEFHLVDMAVLLAGGTPVSIYNSSPSDRIAHVLRHAQAGLAVVDGAFAKRFAAARHDAPSLGAVVGVGGGGDHPLAGLLSSDPLDLETAAAEVTSEDLLTIIYTSGTTGDPKGVMLTHANLAFAVETYATVLGRSLQGLRQVSYLPMAHIAERLATHYFHIAEGSVVTTCDDLATLLPTMVAVQPEWFFSAPRLWEKLQAGIEAMAAADPPQAEGLAEARRLGWAVFLAGRDGGGPSAALAREWEAARREHVEPVLRKVGLGSVIIALTGAAPTPRHTSEFFLSLGVPLSEVWGMSETSGLGTWSPHHIVPGTVGTPTPGIELRLGDDDEILVRGPCVFAGYLNEPGRTAQVLDADGWLHTGDVGRFDTRGNLQIVDRIKDLIVPSSGHNVSPAQLEALLKQCPLVGQACVVGDGRPHVVALLVPDPDVARVWAARHRVEGVSLADLARHPDFRAEIATFVEGINGQVPPAERIAAFEVIGEEWLPDSDVLTPTAKLKRRAVGQRYFRLIDGLYQAVRVDEHAPPVG